MAKYGRSFTRIPRINPQRGGGGSRANIMRSYLGGTDAFGTVQMSRPNRPLQTPEISTPRVSPSGVVRGDRQQGRGQDAAQVEQAVTNHPQGEGAVSANYDAAQRGTGMFADFVYRPSLQSQLDSLVRGANYRDATARRSLEQAVSSLLGSNVTMIGWAGDTPRFVQSTTRFV